MNYLEWGPPKYLPAGPKHRCHSELYYITLKCVLLMWQARPNLFCELKETASRQNQSGVLTEIQMMIIIMIPRHASTSGSAAAHLSAAPGETSATFERRFHRLFPFFSPPPPPQLTTLRGAILEDAIPSTARHGTARGLPLKEVLEYVIPELNIQCLRMAINSPKVPEQLLKLDEQGVSRIDQDDQHVDALK